MLPHAPFFSSTLYFEDYDFPISLLQKANTDPPRSLGWRPSADCTSVLGSHRRRSYYQPCLRACAQQQAGSTWPAVDGCQVSATAGCEEKPGSDSRPVNKLVAICIPFRDSAVLYERIHCVRSSRLGDLKEATAEESCADCEVIETKGQKRLF